MNKANLLMGLCFLWAAYPTSAEAGGSANDYPFRPVSVGQLDNEKSWPPNLDAAQIGLRTKNTFSWKISDKGKDLSDDVFHIDIDIKYNNSNYSLSGIFNVFHGDVGGFSTAIGDLNMGQLSFKKLRIPLGLTDALCPEITKAWEKDGSAIDAECNLRKKQYSTDWIAPTNPDDFLKDEAIPPIVIYDLDGDGSAEIIFQLLGGNRLGPEYTIYQKDSHGVVRPTAKFRGSSEIRQKGKEIDTFWSSSVCDGNVKEIYRSIDGIYMIAEADEYFMGVNPETKKEDCGSRRSIYNYETKKYDATVIFDGT